MAEVERDRRVVFHAGSFLPLEGALWRELSAVREAEPLAPVLVLVPTNLLRRHLIACGAQQGGCLNVHFLTFVDLARKIGEPVLAIKGRAPLPRLGAEIIARRLCREARGEYFAPLAERPGFHRALLATIGDFKEAGHGPAGLRRSMAGSLRRDRWLVPKLQQFHELWAAYEARVAELQLYDDADLLASAANAAPRDKWLALATAVFVYGFYDLNELQRRLVAACTADRRARAFFPYQPEAEAFRYAEPTFEWLVRQGFEPREEPEAELPAELRVLHRNLFGPLEKSERRAGERVRIVGASDEVGEVRAIIRSAVAAARQGQPLSRVGILLRQAGSYAPLFAEECEAGGLAAYHHDPPPLASCRAGRSLLMLLRLLRSELARSDVMDFVTYADIPFEGLLPSLTCEPSPADWDLLSIQAGIVKGRENWESRLATLRRRLKAQAEERRAERHLAALDAFERFLKAFFDALEAVPDQGSWSDLVDAVLAVFCRFVRDSEERQQVAEEAAGLGALDATGETADLDTLARLAAEALEARRPRRPPQGTFGSCGPVVVDLMEGRGVPFDVVFVPGLVEKGFPAPPSQDPLLSDAERARLTAAGLGLALKSERAKEERLLFRLAVAAARESVVLTYPRLDPSSGRERVPSHFLLRAIEAVAGQRWGYRRLEEFEGHERAAAPAFSPEEPKDAWREAEYDLALVRQAVAQRKGAEIGYLTRVSPTFGAALRAESRRWGERQFTEYDGVLASEAALAALAKRLGPAPWRLRATALEQYASCPFRYFLEQVLEVEALEEPEAVRRLSGLDRGRLMHKILYRALSRAKSEGRLPLKLRDEERVLEAAQEGFAEFEQGGLIGYPALWELERDGLALDLRRFVLEEASDKEGYVPVYFEVSFGRKPREGDVELWDEQGVLFDLGEAGKVRVVGRIDRIDVRPDRKGGRVIDYKAGSRPKKLKADSFAGGTALQLPIYLKAAEVLLGDAVMDVAIYRYVTARGGYSALGFSRQALAARERELLSILSAIACGIRKGRFFAGLVDAPCRNCDYRVVCGAAAQALTRRKADDPAARAYLEMREIE